MTKPTKCKWATFTYVWKETSITNVFRRADLKIAFRTNNTTGNLFGHRNLAPEKFTLLGAYKLTCPDCNKAYVGQTGRRFYIRYNEHKIAFYNNSHTSSFAQHLHEHAHSFGPIDVMQSLHHHTKGAHLNMVEKFYIHAEYVANNHLNDNYSIFPNIISDTFLKTHRPLKKKPHPLPSTPWKRSKTQTLQYTTLPTHNKQTTSKGIANTHTPHTSA